ncbi:MAG: PGPGW domain-containing protein [Actinobacteria bacterium]|nr:PGPGW domain-containing protein [Actinomycetota bacterium]
MDHRPRGRVRRWGAGVLGLSIVAIGLVLMPLPGPGTVIVLLGLAYLRRDYAWADRMLARVRGWTAIAIPERLLSRVRGRRRGDAGR